MVVINCIGNACVRIILVSMLGLVLGLDLVDFSFSFRCRVRKWISIHVSVLLSTQIRIEYGTPIRVSIWV